jgi:hypothetical protein
MKICGTWNIQIREQNSYIRWAFLEENSEEKSLSRREAISDHERKLVSNVMHDNVLCVRGYVVDTIKEVVEHENPLDMAYNDYEPDSEEHMALYDVAVDRHLRSLDLARCVFHGKSEGVTGIPEDFILSFFLDGRCNERVKDAYREILPKLKTWYSDSIRYRWDEAQCYAQFRNLRGHTFFSTKGGRIGYAHPGCRPGDQIAVFYGGEPLYIIRHLEMKSDEDDASREAADHVQYLGAAFIPHLMEQHQRDAAHIGPDTTFFIH